MSKTIKKQKKAGDIICFNEKAKQALVLLVGILLLSVSIKLYNTKTANVTEDVTEDSEYITGNLAFEEIKYEPIIFKRGSLIKYTYTSEVDAKRALFSAKRYYGQVKSAGFNYKAISILFSQAEIAYTGKDYKKAIKYCGDIEAEKKRIFSLYDDLVLIKNRLNLYTKIIDRDKFLAYKKADDAFKNGRYGEAEILIGRLKVELKISQWK